MEASPSRQAGSHCKWDFCTSTFRSPNELYHHLTMVHIAHEKLEHVPHKRRRISKGIYIVLRDQKLSDQIPMRFSQSTGDITTTDGNTTYTTIPYPPSFPSQVPLLPALVGRQSQASDKNSYAAVSPPFLPRELRHTMDTFAGAFQVNEDQHMSDNHLLPDTQPSQTSIPSSGSFNPPTQPFPSQPSSQSQKLDSQLSTKNTPQVLEKESQSRDRSTSITSGVNLSFGVTPQKGSQQSSEVKKRSSTELAGFAWGQGV